MFGLFKKDPTKKLQQKIEQKYNQSVAFQRNGKLKEYGDVMKEIDLLEQELIDLRAAD
jgi:hypothetical protein